LRRGSLEAVAAALMGWAAFGACGAPEWNWTTPQVLDQPALAEHLKPRGGEKLVLANFWATW
jgi:hypothetical protein